VTKQISCEVVKSVPLASDIFLDLAKHGIHNNPESNEDTISVKVRLRHVGNQTCYQSRFDTSITYIHESVSGKILDFYV
jgi:hypothetical protein